MSTRGQRVLASFALAVLMFIVANGFPKAVVILQLGSHPASAVQAAQTVDSTIQFTDVSTSAGMPPGPTMSFGAAWGDYDGDGWIDLFLNQHFEDWPFLLHNNGDGTFTEHAVEAGMDKWSDRHGSQWADFDEDGDLDLYVTTGGEHGTGETDGQLWVNNGDGPLNTFVDKAEEMGVLNSVGRGRTLNWFDYDGDRDLDMYVTNFWEWEGHIPSRLYRNDGDVFTDIAATARLTDLLNVLCGTLIHYNPDEDLRLDIIVAPGVPEYGDPVLYKSEGDGTFTKILSGTSGLSGRMFHGLAWGDYDNDGDGDLFAAQARISIERASKLFRNNGDGSFTDVLDSAGLSGVDEYTYPNKRNTIRASLWLDVDNDGDLDLFVVRGNDDRELLEDQPDLLYRNNLVEIGTPTFTDITAEAGVAGPLDGGGEGAAYADYDRDGFLDLIVTNGDAPKLGLNQLFKNEGNCNHWLRVELQGTRSNVHAIGSRVWVFVGDAMQYSEYLDFGACHCQNERVAHFGLGSATTVDLLRVQWPSGVIQEWTDVAANQLLTLVEPQVFYLPLVVKK